MSFERPGGALAVVGVLALSGSAWAVYAAPVTGVVQEQGASTPVEGAIVTLQATESD